MSNKIFMNISTIENLVNGFIHEMHLCGYRYHIQERWMKQFEMFCSDLNFMPKDISKDILEAFCNKNTNESQQTKQQRLHMMTKFSEYLLKNGYKIECPEKPLKPFKYPRHIPYIFTEIEIKNMFIAIDSWETTSQSRGNRKEINPLLFRLYYGCGLREMEALKLKISDINLAEGILAVHNSKNGRSRLVPMADRLVEKCRYYIEKMHTYSERSAYLFPGRDAGTHISNTSTYKRFREYLWKTRIPHTGNGPCIHHLRHTFCVHRLKRWMMSGYDITNMMAYLSAYLGHVDFRGTEYYLRLTSDLYPELISRLETSHGMIIPKGGILDETDY